MLMETGSEFQIRELCIGCLGHATEKRVPVFLANCAGGSPLSETTLSSELLQRNSMLITFIHFQCTLTIHCTLAHGLLPNRSA